MRLLKDLHLKLEPMYLETDEHMVDFGSGDLKTIAVSQLRVCILQRSI